jgi:hypothetical protein
MNLKPLIFGAIDAGITTVIATIVAYEIVKKNTINAYSSDFWKGFSIGYALRSDDKCKSSKNSKA